MPVSASEDVNRNARIFFARDESRFQRSGCVRIDRIASVRTVDGNHLSRALKLDLNRVCHAALPVLPVFDQVIDNFRLCQRRGVAEIIKAVLGDLAQDAAHDLAGASLGEPRRKLDQVW